VSRGLFVTGTDTGVGKTLVSCAILAALRKRGARIGVFKPAETGCLPGPDGRLRGADATRLRAAAGLAQPLGSVATALYAVPAAPLVAAEAAGEAIDPPSLRKGFDAVADGTDAVLVEGAGGLLVPIAEGFTTADLMEALDLPILVVVGSKLGCLNHALLTLEALEQRKLSVAGWVLNHAEAGPEDAHAVVTNRATLSRFTRQPDLGSLPYLRPHAAEDLRELAALAERSLELDALARAMGL